MADIEHFKAQQADAIQGPRSWDGHFLACCGDPCTSRGWGICCLTLWLPCITHGLNLKYLYNTQKAVLGVLLFLALCYVLPCIVFPAVFLTVFRAPDIVACEVDLINAQPTTGPVDPDFTQKLLICQKPGWTKVWIVVAFMWAATISLIIYLTIQRMKTRQRLAIPATSNSCARFLQDFCIMWWCATCALCQENRTLQKRVTAIPRDHSTPITPPAPSKMEV